MTQDELDTRDIEAALALMPEGSIPFPCEIVITSRDSAGRPTAIEIIHHLEENQNAGS
jgi:hypothetical protein